MKKFATLPKTMQSVENRCLNVYSIEFARQKYNASELCTVEISTKRPTAKNDISKEWTHSKRVCVT